MARQQRTRVRDVLPGDPLHLHRAVDIDDGVDPAFALSALSPPFKLARAGADAMMSDAPGRMATSRTGLGAGKLRRERSMGDGSGVDRMGMCADRARRLPGDGPLPRLSALAGARHDVSCAVLIEKVLCLEREGVHRENATVIISRRRRGIGGRVLVQSDGSALWVVVVRVAPR